MHTPLDSLAKPVVIVSYQCLSVQPGEQTVLWRRTQKHPVKNCSCTRGHIICFSCYSLSQKPYANFLVLYWLSYSGIFIEQLKEDCLPFLSLFISPVTQMSFPPGLSLCLCLFTLFATANTAAAGSASPQASGSLKHGHHYSLRQDSPLAIETALLVRHPK